MTHNTLLRDFRLQLAVGVLFLLSFAAISGVSAAPLVVETDALSPEEQKKKFHLPEGFEIQLVVSEESIGQPMNLSFDAAGRLWITHSIEYPYPVEGEGVEPRDGRFQGMGKPPARDRLTVISGIGPDGKPQKIQHFAGELNIPIGVVPTKLTDSQTEALVFSIPNIYHLTDSNNDGQADAREKMFGPFGNLDTHGMTNSFTRWIDGWIYACHGFRNTTSIQGTDGHVVSMNSGNTFRFLEDGSHVEQFTWGQVNPFGLTFDPWGHAYNADCHSMPLTCLIPEAYYSSFGKPHDGLGYGPDMIDHNHGSTGICGVAWYEAAQFPQEYQGCIFLCNPVSGTVHRDRIHFRGSSPWVETQPEFITCDDGWFRPVDVKLGPDGALYIADFYNAIIGHYEVPLEHPRRDRHHGRVWRVVYKGKEGVSLPNLVAMSNTQLVDLLGNENLTIRMLATNMLVDRGADAATIEQLNSLLGKNSSSDAVASHQVHAMWVLNRLGKLTDDLLRQQSASTSPLVRTHVARILSERSELSDSLQAVLVQLLRDEHSIVQRAAVQASAIHSSAQTLDILLDLLMTDGKVADGDSHLRHALVIALRDHLRDASDEDLPLVQDRLLVVAESAPQLVSQLALGTRNERGAALAGRLISLDGSDRLALVRHLAQFGDRDQLTAYASQQSELPIENLDQQVRQIESFYEGLAARGIDAAPLIQVWGEKLVAKLLAQPARPQLGWAGLTVDGTAIDTPAFVPQRRASADGNQEGMFYCSLPRGEQVTGMLRSAPFPAPAEFDFFIAGHNAFPDKPLKGTNFVKLLDANTGEMLMSTSPPRNDTAQHVVWDLSGHAGKQVYLQLVDGDTDTAYAWMAVGRFSIAELNPGAASPHMLAAGLIARLKLTSLEKNLKELMSSDESPATVKLQAAESWLGLHPNSRRAAMLFVARSTTSPEVQQKCLAVLSATDDVSDESLKFAMDNLTQQGQYQLVTALVTDSAGGEALLRLIEHGHASALLLTRPEVVERLKALGLASLEDRIATLTSNLPPLSQQTEELIANRKAVLQQTSQFDLQAGKTLFEKNCAACHQFKGTGNKIGPQLDGMANRGMQRLLEDVLNPNQNVDTAFRVTTLALKSGQVLTGLLRRDEGATLVFADSKGKEFVVAKADIEEQRQSALSLMPANVGETIPEADFAQLVHFLLTP
ncbi:MAG: c-type cytochrome [Planctomycetaceae bacterium]|nr:c-type cytochrome [Planctomycetaceae bacterium]